MSTASTAPLGADRAVQRSPADIVYRRAWWSLLLYPVAAVAAFVIGEGLFSWLDDGVGDAPFWVAPVSAIPALLVLVIPGVLVVVEGRMAIRLGRAEAKMPAVIGGAIAFAVVAQTILVHIFG